MNFPFFIARRYLFSKKSTHVINVISSISVIGVAVATMALVIVLSDLMVSTTWWLRSLRASTRS